MCPGTASFIRADTADTASCWALNSTEAAQMALDRFPLQAEVPGVSPSICSAPPGARGNPFIAEWARAHAGRKAAAFQHRCLPPLWACAGTQATILLIPEPGRDGNADIACQCTGGEIEASGGPLPQQPAGSVRRSHTATEATSRLTGRMHYALWFKSVQFSAQVPLCSCVVV